MFFLFYKRVSTHYSLKYPKYDKLNKRPPAPTWSQTSATTHYGRCPWLIDYSINRNPQQAWAVAQAKVALGNTLEPKCGVSVPHLTWVENGRKCWIL
jgi:hypothetical protein